MQVVWDFLASPYFQAPAIPLILLLLKPLTKKLVRGPASPLSWNDYYLGVDFMYGTLSSALVYAGALWRRRQATTVNNPTDDQLMSASAFVFIAFLLLIVVLCLHQEFEPRRRGGRDERSRRLWLGAFGNLLGAGMLVAFVLLVQGVL